MEVRELDSRDRSRDRSSADHGVAIVENSRLPHSDTEHRTVEVEAEPA